MHAWLPGLLLPWAKLFDMRLVFLLTALLLSGCGAFRKAAVGPTTQPYRSARLLDPSSPRLLVEIDYIEGHAPAKRGLMLLQRRLELYLDKPGGVELVIDQELPASAWDGRRESMGRIIFKHASPPADGTAYIYALVAPRYKNFRGMSYRPGDIRGVDYPAMALFTEAIPGILWVTRGHQQGSVLLHEVGHLVGLVTNDAHRDGGHCTNAWCLMYDGVDLRSGVVFALPILFAGQLPTRFCRDCRRDLWGDELLPGKRKKAPAPESSPHSM